jgi:hypothetical protein
MRKLLKPTRNFRSLSFSSRLLVVLSTLLLLEGLALHLVSGPGFEHKQKTILEGRWDKLESKIDTVSEEIDSKLEKLTIATNAYMDSFMVVLQHAVSTGNFDELDALSRRQYEGNIKSDLSFFGLGYCLELGKDSSDIDFEETHKSIFIRADSIGDPYTYKALPLDYDFRDCGLASAGWYHELVHKSNTAGKWVEPYFGDNANAVLAEYGRRITLPHGQDTLRGIVYFDYSLYDVKRIVEETLSGLPKTVFGYVLSEDGKMLYHPNNVLWQRKDLIDISLFGQNQDDEGCNLCRFAEYIHCRAQGDVAACDKRFCAYGFQEGKRSSYSFRNDQQKDSRIFKKIPSTSWYFVLIYPDYVEQLSNNTKRKMLLSTIIVFVLLEILILCYTVFYFITNLQTDRNEVAKTSVLFSIFFLMDFILICAFSYNFSSDLNIQDDENMNLVRHEDCAQSIVSKCLDLDSPQPVNIGLKLDVLSIRNAHELQVAGYYWLRKEDQLKNTIKIEGEKPFTAITEENAADKDGTGKPSIASADISDLGLYFPDLMENRTQRNFKPQFFSANGDSIIYKRFEVVLKQNFNYSKFPFDHQTITIRLRHKKFWDKQFLIPDFKYQVKDLKKDSSGLNRNAELEEWNVEGIHFAYETKDYTNKSPFVEQRPIYNDPAYCVYNDRYDSQDTSRYQKLSNTFQSGDDTNKYAELLYILDIKRQYFRPMIAFLLPVAVILILLFFYVNRIETYRPGSFLDEAATLLFTLLLSHFALREFLPFKGMIYIEFFYFIVYIAIVVYIINRNIYYAHKEAEHQVSSGLLKILMWERNLIAIVAFWPVTILSFIFISIGFFL